MKSNRSSRAHPKSPGIFKRNHQPLSEVLLTGSCLLMVGVLVFWRFLFGDAVLLYKDIGSDSLISYYPDFVQLSEYLRRHGFPSWSFNVGMGQDLAYAAGFLVWQPVSWLPKHLIANALVYQHLGKILVAGLLFFRFLKLRHLSPPAPLLGSLLLCFSAYMCMGSCWYPLADEVVCFAAILLGVEVIFQSGRWLLLVLAVALAGMITPFHLYLCAIFLLLYVPVRLFEKYGWRPDIIFPLCSRLALLALLGVGLGAIITLPHLDAVLKSPRGSGTTSAASILSAFPVFGFESALHYLTAGMKFFSNDILGVGDGFRGWQNYLEAPLPYCGLLCLLVFPQSITNKSLRARIIFSVFAAAILIPTLFPWFRYLFWLFQGDYYRTYSLLCVLGMITITMIVFSRYIQGHPINLWLLAATLLLLVGLLYFPSDLFRPLVDHGIRRAATFFLCLNALLLMTGQLLKRPALAGTFILILSIIELAYFDRITVSDRKIVTKQDLEAKTGYNDDTVEAVRDIKAHDSGFFRITKLRSSAPTTETSLNDAMVFDYYGTSSYSSFNNVNYTNFLTAVDAIRPHSEADTRWCVGLLNDPILSLFAGEKYALTEDPMPFQRAIQYEFVKRYQQDYLFRNARFLPLGLAFSRYITEDAFLKLPPGEKPGTLLQAAVVSKRELGDQLGLLPADLSELEYDVRNLSLGEVVAERRKTGLELTSFRQTRIEGDISLEQKSILVVQTPFDPGWHATQDGAAAPILKVDAGLLGVAVDAGKHKIQLHYRNPVLIPALLTTLTSLLILAIALRRWPRIHLAET